jgi:hypothetical protein
METRHEIRAAGLVSRTIALLVAALASAAVSLGSIAILVTQSPGV